MSSEHFTIRERYGKLREDPLRKKLPFSEGIRDVHEVVFHPYANESQKERALIAWLQGKGNQPCIFGQIAAAKKQIHVCMISDQDLQRSDEFIAEKIRNGLLRWKRRSVRPTPEFSPPSHGFLLAIASPRVALAAPDDRLKDFACEILKVWNCASTLTNAGTVYWENLFLQEYPKSNYVRFTFSVDFFATQGDGRWWADHRFPCGIAFTANSVGHMRRFKEWYQQAVDQTPWLVQTAMGTIDSAAKTPWGEANWLKSLADGNPVEAELPSPLRPGKFHGKDWTRYAGRWHTDVAIRDEFFFEQDNPPEHVINNSYIQDFAYLYDENNSDYAKFVVGEEISYDEVCKAIGNPKEYVEIETPQIKADSSSPKYQEVEKLLAKCERWRLSPNELLSLEKGE